MSETKLNCYNRGCGQDFDPENNAEDACRHHPGIPFFHDVYKGWTCCNKKSVDFTEFLNIKGCALAKHSNQKPPEPETPAKPVEITEPVPIRPPVEAANAPTIPRPDLDTPLVTITPVVAPALKQSIDNILPIIVKGVSAPVSDIVTVGTVCKNGGCGCTYESPDSDATACVHHPGVPIFHEGLKYWSCCTKRTSDFTAFLAQKGCGEGKHKWTQPVSEAESIKCRYDWHQTAAHVVIAVYAKMYHYAKSTVKVNPVRLAVRLVFPQQNDAQFNIDLELKGIIDVDKTKVQYFGTKVEITLEKSTPGNWTKLDVPHQLPKSIANAQPAAPEIPEDDGIESDVDLDDIEAISGVQITEVPVDVD